MPPTLDYASPKSDKSRRPFWKLTLAEWIVVFLIVAVMGAMLTPALFPHRHASATRVKFLSHLRQIGFALTLYAEHNKGVYPARLADACAMQLPAAALVCPESKTETAAADGPTTQQTLNNVFAANNHVTYVYLAGGMKKSSLKPQAILAYEPLGLHGKNTNASANVLFADGHAASIPAAVFAKMIVQLNAGQNPPPATAGH